MASDVEKLGDLMMTDLPESCRSEVNVLRKKLANDEEGWRALCVVMRDLARLTQPAASGEVVFNFATVHRFATDHGVDYNRLCKLVRECVYATPQPDADTVRDAARYRWLRDSSHEALCIRTQGTDATHSARWAYYPVTGKKADAAIDSAIKGEK